MNQEEFTRMLADEGYEQVVTIEREANGFLGLHSHPFEAKALIIEGEIQIWVEEQEQKCAVGHIFHLNAEVEHAERYGPAGVKYLVGRKPLVSSGL